MRRDDEYAAFLTAKATIAGVDGFPVELDEIHPVLKPHQRAIVQWAVAGGGGRLMAWITRSHRGKTTVQHQCCTSAAPFPTAVG